MSSLPLRPEFSLFHSTSNSVLRWFMCLACQSVDLWPVCPSPLDHFTHKCPRRNTKTEVFNKNKDVATEKWGSVILLSPWGCWRGHTTASHQWQTDRQTHTIWRTFPVSSQSRLGVQAAFDWKTKERKLRLNLTDDWTQASLLSYYNTFRE